MKYIIFKISLFTLLLLSSRSYSQNFSSFLKYQLTQGEHILPYRILLPKNFDANKEYPLVLFLHGRGESGNDNEKQLQNGAALFLKENVRNKYPAIIVFPQNPEESYWSNVQILTTPENKREFYFTDGQKPSNSMEMLIQALDNLQRQYKIKQNQIYVMGLSMGGMGTFEIVNRMPNTFAASIAICGGANPITAPNLKNTKWWIFHGAKDDIVSPNFSEEMVKAMKMNKVDVKFTLYPNANHNSWDSALAEPYLLEWLFKQRLNSL